MSHTMTRRSGWIIECLKRSQEASPPLSVMQHRTTGWMDPLSPSSSQKNLINRALAMPNLVTNDLLGVPWPPCHVSAPPLPPPFCGLECAGSGGWERKHRIGETEGKRGARRGRDCRMPQSTSALTSWLPQAGQRSNLGNWELILTTPKIIIDVFPMAIFTNQSVIYSSVSYPTVAII